MQEMGIEIIKSSGEKMLFSLDKLRKSLKHSGADHNLVEQIVSKVKEELYEGITTNEIYNRAYAILKKNKSVFASKYKLKKAIYELGPTGFPFERFVAAILSYSGYQTSVNQHLNGNCVNHEIDVIAEKNNTTTIIECKFVGLYLLSWDFPKNEGLKDRIDRLSLYPITVSTLLTNREKQFILSRDIVLCRQLWKNKFLLDHLGISNLRKKRILDELNQLCNS